MNDGRQWALDAREKMARLQAVFRAAKAHVLDQNVQYICPQSKLAAREIIQHVQIESLFDDGDEHMQAFLDDYRTVALRQPPLTSAEEAQLKEVAQAGLSAPYFRHVATTDCRPCASFDTDLRGYFYMLYDTLWNRVSEKGRPTQ